MGDPTRARRVLVVAAFAAVYTIWGSTYVAIRYALETLPPFLMAGVRFLVAGGALYAYARLRGAPRPTVREWRGTGVVGLLLLFGGNGGVVWAEQRVASGLAALLVAGVPIWMVLLDWLRPGGERPRGGVAFGIVVGFAGLFLLVGPQSVLAGTGGGIDPAGAAVLILASICWATGSLYARRAPMPDGRLIAIAMEMLVGGAALTVVALALGEPWGVDWGAISTTSLLALGYLVAFGSLVGFTAYSYLLGVASPAAIGTYAYVNPIVAVFLGWSLASEPVTPRMVVAAAVIVGSVAVTTITQARPRAGITRAADARASAAAPHPAAQARARRRGG